MKITSVLKNLLLLHGRVEIPELGAFIAKEVSAKVDADKGEIAPPSKELFFDISDPKKDDVLKNALIAAGSTEDEADKQISDFVNSAKNAFNENKSFVIEDLGSLKKDADNIIFIHSPEASSLSVDAIGMKKVTISSDEMKAISENKNIKTKEEKIKTKIAKKQKTPKIAALKEPKAKKVVDKAKRKKAIKSTLIVLPIIALLVFLGLFYQPIISKAKSIFAKNTQDTTKNIVNNDVDTLTFTDNTNIDTASDNTVIIDDNDYSDDFGNDVEYRKILDAHIPNTAEVYLGNNYKKFYLIVNSYKQNSYAENYAQQLRAQGYNPEILNGTDYYRVSLNGYNTADNLLVDYDHYYNKFSGKIWVLINKQ
ncbi:MAG: SPOR domain-containing protein [Bacteroidales bacterium]|nr:SPOR domain-containing protein [Bacteroidales bacterium]